MTDLGHGQPDKFTKDVQFDTGVKLDPVSGQLILGSQAAGIDYSVLFNGENSQGTFTHLEDENIFSLSTNLLIDNDAAVGDSAALTLRSGTSGTSSLNLGDTDSDTIGRIRYDNSVNAMTFDTNTSTALTIDSSGNVGIGVTPSALLHVDGGDIYLVNNGGNPRYLVGDDTVSAFGSLFWDSANNYLRLETNGTNGIKLNGNNVAIGNIFPSQPLIVGSGSTALFTVNSSGAVQVNTGGSFALPNGAAINEFSTDGTLAGDSDVAVPTEQAVKTYVDDHPSSGIWQRVSTTISPQTAGDVLNMGTGSVTSQTATLTGTDAGILSMENNTWFRVKNTGGTYENFLWGRASDNRTYMNYGSAGLRVRNSSESIALELDNSLNFDIVGYVSAGNISTRWRMIAYSTTSPAVGGTATLATGITGTRYLQTHVSINDTSNDWSCAGDNAAAAFFIYWHNSTTGNVGIYVDPSASALASRTTRVTVWYAP